MHPRTLTVDRGVDPRAGHLKGKTQIGPKGFFFLVCTNQNIRGNEGVKRK